MWDGLASLAITIHNWGMHWDYYSQCTIDSASRYTHIISPENHPLSIQVCQEVSPGISVSFPYQTPWEDDHDRWSVSKASYSFSSPIFILYASLLISAYSLQVLQMSILLIFGGCKRLLKTSTTSSLQLPILTWVRTLPRTGSRHRYIPESKS